jgi:hypothetical protein
MELRSVVFVWQIRKYASSGCLPLVLKENQSQWQLQNVKIAVIKIYLRRIAFEERYHRPNSHIAVAMVKK